MKSNYKKDVSYRIKVLLKGHMALFKDENLLVTYNRGNICTYNIKTMELLKKNKVPFQKSRYYFISKFYIFSRIFRLFPRTFCQSDNMLYFGMRGNIYFIDLLNHNIVIDHKLVAGGSSPLMISNIEYLNNFENMVVFGEYISNKDKSKISIWGKKQGEKKWNIIFTFPEKTINHIHAIIPDKFRNIVWILTGDCDDCSAIWYSDNNFKSVVKFVGGTQKYRSCVAFPTKEGLLFATDSPNKDNSFSLLNEKRELTVISDLPGSVIFGREINDGYVFSTTVEPFEDEERGKIADLFIRKKGPGIKTNNAHIYLYHENKLIEVFSAKKDIFPMVLMQFGLFTFPIGSFGSSELMVNSQSLKKYGNSILLITKIT